MYMHRYGVLAHKAGGAWVLGVAAVLAMEPASAQAPAPASVPGLGTAPSEAVQRQANSPYRFILQNANAPSRAKPAPAPAPAAAPAAVEVKKLKPVEQAAITRPAPAAPAPAAEPEPVPVPEPLVSLPTPEPVPPRLEVIPVQTDDPRLPSTLLRQRPSGVVRVAFDLNPDGSTGNVKVVSSTNRALNRPSIEAVSNWKFQPVDEVLTIETELAYKFD